MSCKCKNIIENFQGGTIPLDTIFNGNVQICGPGKSLNVSNIDGCSPTTIGSQSGCTSATTTVLIVSGKTNFSCDVNVAHGGIFSGGTNIMDMFTTVPGTDINVTGGTYSNTTGCATFTTNQGDDFDICGFMTGFTNNFVTGGTFNSSVGVLTLLNNNGNTFDISGFTTTNTNPTFTGNTSATCINELWVSNISGCSPVTIGTELITEAGLKTDFIRYNSSADTMFIGSDDTSEGRIELRKTGGEIKIWGDSDLNLYSETGDVKLLMSDVMSLEAQQHTFLSTSPDVRLKRTIASADTSLSFMSPANVSSAKLYYKGVDSTFRIDTFNGITSEEALKIDFNQNVGLSSNLNVSGNTNTFGTISSGGTNLDQLFLPISATADTFVIAGTYIDSTGTISLLRNDGNFVNITGLTDTYVTGGTISTSATDLNNSGKIGLFYKNADGTPRLLPFEDTFTTGGTFTSNSGILSFTKNDSSSFTVSGLPTDSDFVWGGGSLGNFSVKQITDTTTDATGNYAVAEGSGTEASGDNSHAEGKDTLASGLSSHAEGFATVASEWTSHAEGAQTIASGIHSHSEGFLTTASGDYSHAEGVQTTASAVASKAEGNNTVASANASKAEGFLTTASGVNSHSQNNQTKASGDNSHAGGKYSEASGNTSFIHSTNSLVTGDRSVVLGGQNITGTTNDTVYVPFLNIGNVGVATPLNNLGIDSNGFIVTADTSSTNVFVDSGNVDVVTQQLIFTNTTGGTFNVTNAAALFSDNDINVTGGTYNPNNGCVSFNTNSGTTFDVCGFVTGLTDTFITGATLVGTTLNLKRNNGLSNVTVDLSPLSGTSVNNFVTGGTFSSGSGILSLFNNDGNTFNVSGFTSGGGSGGTFTGNTSATCINELWVSNISGCSPVTIGTEVVVKNNLNSSGVISSDTIGLSKSWLTSPPYIELFSHEPMSKALYFNKNTMLEKVFMGDPTNYDPDSLFTIYSDVAIKSGMTVTSDVEVGNDIRSKTFTMKDGGVTSKVLSVVPMNSQLNIGESSNFNKYFLGNETQPPSSVFATTFTVYADINATRELTVTSGITGNSLNVIGGSIFSGGTNLDQLFAPISATDTNIYDNNGKLSSDRTVSLEGNKLDFSGVTGNVSVTDGHLTITSSGTNTSDTVFLVKDSAGNHIIEGLDTGQVHVGDLINSASPTNPTLMIGAGKAPNDRGSLAFTSTGIGVGGDNDATGDYLHFLLPGSNNSRWKFDTSSAFGFTLVSRQNNTFGSGSGTRSSFYTSRTYGVDFLLGYANSLGVTDTVGYRFNTKDSTSAGANDVERFVIENGESKTKSYFDNISVLGVGTSNPSTATTLHVSGNTLVSGDMKVGSTLAIGSLGTGNAVSNLGIDSSGIVVVGDPSSATTFNVFNTSPASPDPKNIYDDGFIRIWFDESGSDDIECEVLTDPSTGKVHFSWDEPSDGTAGAADVDSSSNVVSLNQLFEDDDRMNLTIWAPLDTTYPYYEMKITKSNFTSTGVPAVLRVNKWNSPT